MEVDDLTVRKTVQELTNLAVTQPEVTSQREAIPEEINILLRLVTKDQRVVTMMMKAMMANRNPTPRDRERRV
jgi:hypothetical protein